MAAPAARAGRVTRIGAEDSNQHPVAAPLDRARMKRLMDIADEVHEELERHCAIGAIEAHIGEPLLVVEDSIRRCNHASDRRGQPAATPG